MTERQTTVKRVPKPYWSPDPGSVYIGRPSLFGNPFHMRNEGDRDSVCDQYRDYLNERADTDPVFRSELLRLRGQTLLCYCAPKRCHGDEIVRWLEEHTEEG